MCNLGWNSLHVNIIFINNLSISCNRRYCLYDYYKQNQILTLSLVVDDFRFASVCHRVHVFSTGVRVRSQEPFSPLKNSWIKNSNILINTKACICSCNKEDCRQCKTNDKIILRNDFQCKAARTEDIIYNFRPYNTKLRSHGVFTAATGAFLRNTRGV